MAKKDFDNYFLSVCAQYQEMKNELADLESTCNSTMVDPSIIDNIKQMIEPLKNNYMTLSYVKYLLDTPVKGNKKEKYKRQNKKVLANSKTDVEVKKENNQVIKSLENLNESLKNQG